MPLGKINWANIIAIILQILAGLGGGTTPPAKTFGVSKDEFKAKLTAAMPDGTALDVIDALVLVVEKDWLCISTLITDVEGALIPATPPGPVK
jgi:hypothetical protein